ncbi:hypothetical protein ACFOQM_01150 [Paenibacillus sp. GCM10012307]
MIQTDHRFRLQVRLLSEAVFSSGEKEPNLVQSKVLADPYGCVYLHAKTLKGQMKHQAFWLLKQYSLIDGARAKRFLYSIAELFGINIWELQKLHKEYKDIDNGNVKSLTDYISELLKGNRKLQALPGQGVMRLGHLELPEAVRSDIRKLISEQGHGEDPTNYYSYLTRHDLIEAQTNIRVGIQLEDGIVKDKMFTSCHTVKEGLLFYAPISLHGSVSDELVEDLTRIVYALKRIGSHIHRGRGEVETKFYRMKESSTMQGGIEWDELSSRANHK